VHNLKKNSQKRFFFFRKAVAVLMAQISPAPIANLYRKKIGKGFYIQVGLGGLACFAMNVFNHPQPP